MPFNGKLKGSGGILLRAKMKKSETRQNNHAVEQLAMAIKNMAKGLGGLFGS